MSITDLLLQVDVTAIAESREPLFRVAGKFLLNLSVVFFIVKVGYSRGRHKPDFVFTYFIFNVLIFFLCFLMTRVQLSIGFAFGLFALFSIMRYRTTTIEIREMTYLFVVVALGVLNSVTGPATPVTELLLINTAILITVWASEYVILGQPVGSAFVRYEKIGLLRKGRSHELKLDLEQRMGVTIVNIEVIMLNYMTDTAELQVFYRSTGQVKQASLENLPVHLPTEKVLAGEIHT